MAGVAGELLSRPTAWLWAERSHLVDALGVSRRGPVEARRWVRSQLHAAYGLSLEALECRQLDNAIDAALAVPGTTPERLAKLMLTRGASVTRELASAEDPVAVLVWAAGDYAAEALAREAAVRAANDDRPP